ncbi:MAG: tyrosine-type recombinase/integrase [Gemmatimonadetes bacterium]|nr:tyrosine-type recombinase/integrase [Gemmatimonadota bacterium]
MLTEREVRDAKAEGKTRIFWDGQIRGLGLRVTAKGVKSYILNYRVNGRERRMTLGRASVMSLKAARKQAAEHLEGIRASELDPLEVKQEARERAEQAPTVVDGLDRFFNEFAPNRIKMGRLKKRTAYEYNQQANKYLRPALGKLKIADVKRSDVERMIEPLTGTIRNRVLALTSRLFTQFERWELRPQHSNPAYGIDRAKEEARDRTLDSLELAALSKSLNKFENQHPVSVAVIRFASLTGLRIGEVLSIQWEDINWETGLLVLRDTKTGRRVHHLPEAALNILNDLPHSNRCPWVFSNNGRVATIYRTVWKHFGEITKDAGLENVKLHDLRRSFMTAAAASGVGAHVLRDLLGHKTTAMADRYVRAVGAPVREAREAIGAQTAIKMGLAIEEAEDGEGEGE